MGGDPGLDMSWRRVGLVTAMSSDDYRYELPPKINKIIMKQHAQFVTWANFHCISAVVVVVGTVVVYSGGGGGGGGGGGTVVLVADLYF